MPCRDEETGKYLLPADKLKLCAVGVVVVVVVVVDEETGKYLFPA